MREPDPKRELVRHALATLAYRGGKAVRGAPADFAEFRACKTSRTPSQILAHLGDLIDWAANHNPGKRESTDSLPRSSGLMIVSLRPSPCIPPERLVQGPIADAFACRPDCNAPPYCGISHS
jgi:hypothetical protein